MKSEWEWREDPQTGAPLRYYGDTCTRCKGEMASIAGFQRHVATGSMVCPDLLAQFRAGKPK